MAAPILVTGATGFIGRRLTRDLAADDPRRVVRVLARCGDKAERLFGGSVEAVRGGLADADALARACAGVETVYHIAGVYRFGLCHRALVWEANVEGTEALLRAAKAAGVARVVHVSSGGVLRSDTRAMLDEDDFPATPPPFSSYKYSKWHAERRVLEWARRGFPVTIASPTCPIGAEDEGPTPTGRIIHDFLAGNFPCYCRTGLNFIDVGDVSAGLRRVGQAGRAGARYILGSRNLWLKEFLDLVGEETGLASPRLRIPQWMVWAAGGVGEALHALRLAGGEPRVCLETAFFSGRVQFFDNARTRLELGWEPAADIVPALREALAWFRRGEASPSAALEPEPAGAR